MFGLSADEWTAVGGFAAVVVLFLTVRSSLLGAHDRLVKSLIENPIKRERLGRALNISRFLDTYRAALGTGLDKLDQWMGEYGQIARGYRWCYGIALVYSAFLILLPWVFFGQGAAFGEWVLIEDTEKPFWLRISTLVLIILGGCLLSLSFCRPDFVSSYFLEHYKPKPGRFYFEPTHFISSIIASMLISALAFVPWMIQNIVAHGFILRMMAIMISLYIFSFLGTFAFFYKLHLPKVPWVVGYFGFWLVVVFEIEGSSTLYIVLLCAIAPGIFPFLDSQIRGKHVFLGWLIFAFSLAVFADYMELPPFNEPPLNFVLFLIILPAVNGFLDWMSWLCSRWLGRDLLRHLDGVLSKKFVAFIWHGIVDVLVASILLLMLAFFLPNTARVFFLLADSMFHTPEMSFDRYLCLSAQNPLGSGLWATGMLFSTLVPTVLHLMFLIASPLAFWARPHGQVWEERAAYLCGERETPPEADLPKSPPLRRAALADAGLSRETATKVARWRISQTLLVYPTALLLAALFLFLLWELIQTATGSLPAWLLLIATGDWAFVDACLPGAL